MKWLLLVSIFSFNSTTPVMHQEYFDGVSASHDCFAAKAAYQEIADNMPSSLIVGNNNNAFVFPKPYIYARCVEVK